MGASGFLSVFSGKHNLLGLEEEVFEFNSFDEVSVPDEGSVGDSDVLVLVIDSRDQIAT